MAFTDPHKAYRYSYSGTDTRAFAYFPNVPSRIVEIESLHTISYSIHEAKGQARALGYRGIRGVTQSVRTIAGSLITTVIEDHPLAALMELFSELTSTEQAVTQSELPYHLGWSVDWYSVGVGSGIDNLDFNRRMGVTLPPFNIVLRYVAEGSKWNTDIPDNAATIIPGAAASIVGVHLVDEGSVTSVSDAATEMTYSFLALDVKPLAKQNFQIEAKRVTPNLVVEQAKFDQHSLRTRLFMDRLVPKDFIAIPE